MKKAIIVSLLTIFLFGLATYELIAVEKIISNLEVMTVELQTIITDNKENVVQTETDVKKVRDYWSKHEENLCLMFNHKDLSTITDTLSRLSSSVTNNDYDNAIIEVNLLKEYSEKNRHIMGFNMQNLL